jgi:PhoPQ-activated pathogenicity-related protein
LEDIPKFISVTSDDEFMSFDWTNLGYYDKLKGEKHLCIMPNSEHYLKTALFRVINAAGTFISSIASGKYNRPHFDYSYTEENGDLSITIPPEFKPKFVRLRFAETVSTSRRDFRWTVNANNYTGIDPACHLPYLPMPKMAENDENGDDGP